MQNRKSYNKKFQKSRNSKSFKKSDVEERDKGQFRKTESPNDPSWYIANGQLLKDVASINFNNPTGIVYQLDPTGAAAGTFSSPGVMNIYMAPTAGYSESLSSPINIAAKNIYSFVRHANSGHSNYDSPDLMLYILGMASAYAYYGWLTRIYGMIRIYTQDNRYFGANLVRSCGVDADNIMANLANFRAYINQYALKLSALSVPSTMSLFKRYMWMFSNLFFDENTTKGQIYMYQPAYFYKYEEYEGAGKLVPQPLCLDANGINPATGKTYGDLMQYGDALIAALIGSEDANIMSGDILKAYTSDNVWKLSMISEDYAILPMFSEEVLLQIHNTVFAGEKPVTEAGVNSWDSFQITQDTSIGNGCLICKPRVDQGGNTRSDHILDTWKSGMEPEEVMVATRNMICGSRWAQGFTLLYAFGSEIPMYATIWQLSGAGELGYSRYYAQDDKALWDANFTSMSQSLDYMSKLMYFNEHPQFYLVDYSTSAPYATIDASSSIGEMSNYTVLDNDDLEKMHLTAILSELAVPLLGNIAK